MRNNQFDKFMSDILYNQKRNNNWQMPALDERGAHEQYMKRLRMYRERELWQNRINWSK